MEKSDNYCETDGVLFIKIAVISSCWISNNKMQFQKIYKTKSLERKTTVKIIIKILFKIYLKNDSATTLAINATQNNIKYICNNINVIFLFQENR